MTAAVISVLILQHAAAQAQSGKAGIDKATSEIGGYFGAGEKLMYAVGAVIGLIGAVKVYQKWSGGDQDTSKVAAAWFGACIFLVVVAAILRSFFGVK
ncbi:DUF4134 domain-containing protein [Chitinophaga sp. CC14]|uniref:DUF4134 domain-containing protein n=1 Tax=Chitinophaga sp. CC14 TaxID=3029199 RepID=UPI003B7A0905